MKRKTVRFQGEGWGGCKPLPPPLEKSKMQQICRCHISQSLEYGHTHSANQRFFVSPSIFPFFTFYLPAQKCCLPHCTWRRLVCVVLVSASTKNSVGKVFFPYCLLRRIVGGVGCAGFPELETLNLYYFRPNWHGPICCFTSFFRPDLSTLSQFSG